MIKLGPRQLLAETVEDLPAPRPGVPIYLDCETRSRDESLRSPGDSPYQGDRACMWGITWPESPVAIAVPYRQRDGRNLPVEPVQRWLRDTIRCASEWRNHNVKFDCHNAMVDGVQFSELPRLVDTLVMAKLVDTDRWSHDLKSLMREWLQLGTDSEDVVTRWLDGYKLPRRAKARDYALVPTDILGFYNCDDVLGNRALYEKLDRDLPEQVRPTWEMEQQLTRVLLEMERLGLRVDEKELVKEKARSMMKQIRLATIINEMTGLEYADSHKFSYGLLCGLWGLPVLATNKDSGNPTFDKDALKLYLVHPDVVSDPKKHTVLKTVMGLRAEETFFSLFVESFLDNRGSDSYVHTQYNQVIRTGRMSAKMPNTQQFDDRAKTLIHADGDGCGFADYDYSQIEFRLIAHYIKDPEVIRAYNEDPDTDFHTWVSKISGMKRSPAKTLNFSMAFGAGKNNTIGQLAADEDVILAVTADIDAAIKSGKIAESDRLTAFKSECWSRGESLYRTYHDRLPTLKKTSERAGKICRDRGFIFNLFGRRRHLPQKAAHVAFNTLCQGGAMDIIKRRMIETSHLNWPEIAADGITMRINVHDAIVFHGPIEALKKWEKEIALRLSAPVPALSVPLAVKCKITEGRWGLP